MGDQLQTATADMWSLGMVVLALLSPVTNAELQDLSQMDQADLAESVNTIITKRNEIPSDNALSFVRNCLQVCPTRRLKTDDAARHAWLCTPTKHLEFFQRLDEKMMRSFQVQNEIRAIPWELPDVEHVELHRPAVADDVLDSGHNTGNVCPTNCALAADFTSSALHFASTSKRATKEQKMTALPRDDSPLPSSMITDTMEGKPVAEDDCLRGTIVKRREGKERNSSYKITDATFLPLTGLDKHLKKTRQLNHRVRILEELKATNSRFLETNPESLRTNFPSLDTVRMPESTAKRQKT